MIQRLWFPRFSISDVCICQDWDIGSLPNSFQQALGCKNIIWPGNCSQDWLHFSESFPPPLLHHPLIPISLPRPSDIQHQSEEWVFFYMSRQSSHTHTHTHTHPGLSTPIQTDGEEHDHIHLLETGCLIFSPFTPISFFKSDID